MPEVTGLGTNWNLPNYAGELFTADATQTPFLSMIGGLTGGMQTNNDEFPTGVLYDLPEATQPDISEKASATAPAASAIARKQETNVVQIHQEVLDLTYSKLANSGKMSGINAAMDAPNPRDELTWQTKQKLIKVARDVEYSFLRGKFAKSTADNVANKTRGMIDLCSKGTTVAAAGSVLTLKLLNQLYLEMANNGAMFTNMVAFVSAKQKQAFSQIYAKQFGFNLPATRNVGGVNVTDVETDFCKLGIAWDRFMPDDTILIADIGLIAPVFQAVPNKGVFFLEPLAKVGASERFQLYGQIGLAHGPAFLHGTITGLGDTATP
mgnify:CR=1 FL=1